MSGVSVYVCLCVFDYQKVFESEYLIVPERTAASGVQCTRAIVVALDCQLRN